MSHTTHRAASEPTLQSTENCCASARSRVLSERVLTQAIFNDANNEDVFQKKPGVQPVNDSRAGHKCMYYSRACSSLCCGLALFRGLVFHKG